MATSIYDKVSKWNPLIKMGLMKPKIHLPSLEPPRIPDDIKFMGLSEEDKKLKQDFDKLGIRVPHYHYNMATIKRYMGLQDK